MDHFSDLAAAVQHIVQALGGKLSTLPEAVLLIALCTPTLVSFATRKVLVIVPVAILNAAALLAITAGSTLTLSAVLSVAIFAAAFGCAGYGFRDYRTEQQMAHFADRLDHLDKQVLVFLQALDRRAQSVDSRANETRKLLEGMQMQSRSTQNQTGPVQSQINTLSQAYSS